MIIIISVFLIHGCTNKEEYQSTARVKIEILIPGKGISNEPAPSEVFEYLPSIIKGMGVLRKAANGALTEVLWIDSSNTDSLPIKTADFAKTELAEILYSDKKTGYTKNIRPVTGENIIPLKNILSKATGKHSSYSDLEIVKILARNIEVDFNQTSGEVNITAYWSNPDDAKKIADTVSLAFISFVDEDNAEKIIKIIQSISKENVLAEKEKLISGSSLEKLQARLEEIKNKYNLSIDQSGIPQQPLAISEKEKERNILRPELAKLNSIMEQLIAGTLEEKVRYFILEGNSKLSEQSGKVANIRIEIKKLHVEASEGKDKEKAKTELQNAEINLKAEEAKLRELVDESMAEFQNNLNEKEANLAKLNEEIDSAKQSFFKGTAEYGEIVRQIETEKSKVKSFTTGSVSFGSLLYPSIVSKGEISYDTVKRSRSFDNKYIWIGFGASIVVLLNAFFVIYMVRWAKRKK